MWKRLREVDFIDVWMVDSRENRERGAKWGVYQSFGGWGGGDGADFGLDASLSAGH